MDKKGQVDLQAAHKHFSVACFNKAWDLIDKADRTPDEDEQMIRLSMASFWHWTKREEYGPKNASIAYWQLSRIYATLGRANDARTYGNLCLDASRSEGIGPFYLAYAYEALARASAVEGNQEDMKEYLEKAMQVMSQVTDADEVKILQEDLASISHNLTE